MKIERGQKATFKFKSGHGDTRFRGTVTDWDLDVQDEIPIGIIHIPTERFTKVVKRKKFRIVIEGTIDAPVTLTAMVPKCN